MLLNVSYKCAARQAREGDDLQQSIFANRSIDILCENEVMQNCTFLHWKSTRIRINPMQDRISCQLPFEAPLSNPSTINWIDDSFGWIGSLVRIFTRPPIVDHTDTRSSRSGTNSTSGEVHSMASPEFRSTSIERLSCVPKQFSVSCFHLFHSIFSWFMLSILESAAWPICVELIVLNVFICVCVFLVYCVGC